MCLVKQRCRGLGKVDVDEFGFFRMKIRIPHQFILPNASILPAPKVGIRGELFNTGFEACLAEWKSRKI